MQESLNRQNDISQKPEEVQSMNLGTGTYEDRVDNESLAASSERLGHSCSAGEYASGNSADASGTNGSLPGDCNGMSDFPLDDNTMSNSGSPWYELRRDATALVSQSLQRGCKNFWQLMTSRVSVLLSSAAFCSTSIHQFLKNYEDLNVYVLAGEAFCGVDASEFRKKLKAACESYFSNFHKQNIYVSQKKFLHYNFSLLSTSQIPFFFLITVSLTKSVLHLLSLFYLHSISILERVLKSIMFFWGWKEILSSLLLYILFSLS